jgi:hypothetical protein
MADIPEAESFSHTVTLDDYYLNAESVSEVAYNLSLCNKGHSGLVTLEFKRETIVQMEAALQRQKEEAQRLYHQVISEESNSRLRIHLYRKRQERFKNNNRSATP